MSTPAGSGPQEFLEYGGLASVPGPFHCTDARIVLLPVKADPAKLAALCTGVLGLHADGTPRYAPVGPYVMLSFGSMTVRSTSTGHSRFYNVRYDAMGGSAEHHVALWVPVIADHHDGPVDLVDQFATFMPAIWVDNPVSLLGGRDIYGIAKQWGSHTIADDMRTCGLDVFGGTFGRAELTGMHRLLDITRLGGHHPIQVVSQAVDEVIAGFRKGIEKLRRGEVELPGRALLFQAAHALKHRNLTQVAVRQFRTTHQDGAKGSDPDLVGITTTFATMTPTILTHGFHVEVHPLDSHPLTRSLGIASQDVPVALEVTSEFTLSAT